MSSAAARGAPITVSRVGPEGFRRFATVTAPSSVQKKLLPTVVSNPPTLKSDRLLGDSNPCYNRERAIS